MLANEPRYYREVISAVFKALRPNAEVFTIEPEDLDQAFLRHTPHLVICSHLTELVSRDAPAWIEVFPKGVSRAVVSFMGDRTTHPGMETWTPC